MLRTITAVSLLTFQILFFARATASAQECADCSAGALTEEVRRLRDLVEILAARVESLEAERQRASAPLPSITAPVHRPVEVSGRSAYDFFRDATFNISIDGGYGYNFNRPADGFNSLRAYDPVSNSFGLNMASVVIERAPRPEAGRRFGVRLDLQFGQATETVQGNDANESRPQVYRNVWQAYGTYVAPVGKGLTFDFGKFAGALGYETNYTKDNFNLSRSYFFHFLPFYHLGLRTGYAFSDKFSATHWLVNGAQQSEDFNGFKSQAVLLAFRPSERVIIQTNYYVGREQRDPRRFPDVSHNASLARGSDAATAGSGSLPGGVLPVPDGRLHILDAYATVKITENLTFAAEGDYVINRAESFSAPTRAAGGAGYLRYGITPKLALAGRFEYLSDRGGLYSGAVQDLKEHTFTVEYRVAEGFLMRGEFRRDFSNRAFFSSGRAGGLKKEQNTAALGLVWWFGGKEGAW